MFPRLGFEPLTLKLPLGPTIPKVMGSNPASTNKSEMRHFYFFSNTMNLIDLWNQLALGNFSIKKVF